MSPNLLLVPSAALLLGLFWVFKKLTSLQMPPFAGLLWLYIGALIFASFGFLIAKPEFNFEVSKKGIALALSAGIIIAAFDVLTLVIFKKGVNVSMATPLISGGAILIAVLAGIILLKESVGPVHFLGIAAVITGIILLRF